MSHLDRMLAFARQCEPERIRCAVFVAYSHRLAGWCVEQSYEGALSSDMLAGPFDTREQAEAMLGPAAPATPNRPDYSANLPASIASRRFLGR